MALRYPVWRARAARSAAVAGWADPINIVRMTSAQHILIVLIGAGLAANAPMAGAADGEFYGLFRVRDLTPFGFLRLDMRPAHAIAIEPGTWMFEAELGYQNTWALSREVETYGSGALAARENRPFGGSDLNIKFKREPGPRAA